MRLEWIPIVRQRNWSEFEAIARENPCWTLYETVRELEMGFPGRDDRYRLRQVLKILHEKGYHEEVEEAEHTPPRPNFRAVDPYRLAFATEYDLMGTQFLYVIYRKEKNWVNVAIEHTYHSDDCRALHKLTPHRNRPVNRANGEKNGPPKGYRYSVEMPVPLIASRMLELLETKPPDGSDWPLPQFIYRDLRRLGANAYHPVDRWQVPEYSDEQIRYGWRQCKVSQDWLMFCPECLPCMPEIARVTRDLRKSVDARAEERFRLLQQDWDAIMAFGPVEEFARRCKDTAYLLGSKDEWEAAMLMAAIAKSIEKRGEQSPFFLGLLQHTAKVLPTYFSEAMRGEQILRAA